MKTGCILFQRTPNQKLSSIWNSINVILSSEKKPISLYTKDTVQGLKKKVAELYGKRAEELRIVCLLNFYICISHCQNMPADKNNSSSIFHRYFQVANWSSQTKLLVKKTFCMALKSMLSVQWYIFLCLIERPWKLLTFFI